MNVCFWLRKTFLPFCYFTQQRKWTFVVSFFLQNLKTYCVDSEFIMRYFEHTPFKNGIRNDVWKIIHTVSPQIILLWSDHPYALKIDFPNLTFTDKIWSVTILRNAFGIISFKSFTVLADRAFCVFAAAIYSWSNSFLITSPLTRAQCQWHIRCKLRNFRLFASLRWWIGPHFYAYYLTLRGSLNFSRLKPNSMRWAAWKHRQKLILYTFLKRLFWKSRIKLIPIKNIC